MNAAARAAIIRLTTLAVMLAEIVFNAIEVELERCGMRGCEVRRLADDTVLVRLSRSDQVANCDKLGGNAHVGLQWSTDFNPCTAHLESDDRRIAGSHRWCELKSAAQIMRIAAFGAKLPFAK